MSHEEKSPEELSPEELSPGELSYDDLSAGPDRPSLPIGEIFAGIYQHVWRYRRAYLGQLVLWSVVTWMGQFPVRIVIMLLERGRSSLPVGGVDILPWLVEDAARLFFLVLGGAVIFLSCGCAILFGRRPRAGDALQIPTVTRTFWLTIFLFWIAADLAAALAIHALTIYALGGYAEFLWLSPYAVKAGYNAYPILIWALIGLALPIAAFELSATPFQSAWERLREIRPAVLLLTAMAAAPIFFLQFLLDYGRHSLMLMLMFDHPGMEVAFNLAGLALFWAEIFLTYLSILVLSASTLLVYSRMAPDTDDLAKTFD